MEDEGKAGYYGAVWSTVKKRSKWENGKGIEEERILEWTSSLWGYRPFLITVRYCA
jgi:hypothetical protein